MLKRYAILRGAQLLQILRSMGTWQVVWNGCRLRWWWRWFRVCSSEHTRGCTQRPCQPTQRSRQPPRRRVEVRIENPFLVCEVTLCRFKLFLKGADEFVLSA